MIRFVSWNVIVAFFSLGAFALFRLGISVESTIKRNPCIYYLEQCRTDKRCSENTTERVKLAWSEEHFEQ